MKTGIVQRANSLAAHVSALRTRHRTLDGEISAEQRRPAPDQIKLRWLKARRLVLRDQLVQYEELLRKIKPLAGHKMSSMRSV